MSKVRGWHWLTWNSFETKQAGGERSAINASFKGTKAKVENQKKMEPLALKTFIRS